MAFLSGAIGAQMTAIWFFSSMYSPMHIKGALALEIFAAVHTREFGEIPPNCGMQGRNLQIKKIELLYSNFLFLLSRETSYVGDY